MSTRPEAPRDIPFEATVGAASEGRIARSVRLVRASWRLLRAERSILVLELLSTLAVLGGTAAWVGLGVATAALWGGEAALVLLVPAFYFVIGAGVFFSVAVVAMASAALDGRPIAIRDGLALAWSRRGSIARWTLLAMGVGAVIQVIFDKLPFAVDRVAEWLAGAAWGVVTLLVVPVIAHEGEGATGALRRSARLVRERWGEGVSGAVIVGAWAFVIAIPAVAAAVAGGVLIDAGETAAAVPAFAVAAILLLAATVLGDGLRQVFCAALYRFAVTGEATGGFAPADLSGAVRRRRGLRARLRGRR